jgi:REP element-mobilizing transposase RayT
MKAKPNNKANFYEDGIFHVYNRTNNKELLFISEENRILFLKKYAKYMQHFADTFCWNLLPNHFHFVIRIKSAEEIKKYLQKQPPEKLKRVEKNYLVDKATAELLIECEWKRFFTSYSMCYNKEYNRKGNLFYRSFKRVEVIKESHFTLVIIYVHANAQKHQLCKDFTTYPWSSWHTFLSDRPTLLCRQEVLDWFGGLQQFIEAHKEMSEYYYDGDGGMDEFLEVTPFFKMSPPKPFD